MEKSELKVGQFLMYQTLEDEVPCVVTSIGENNFKVDFFHKNTGVHGMFFKGNTQKMTLSFKSLDPEINLNVDFNERKVIPITRVEAIEYYKKIVKTAEDDLQKAKERGERKVKSAKKRLEMVIANISKIPNA